MEQEKVNTLYVGNDDNYYGLINKALGQDMCISHFFKDELSFAQLPTKNFDIILIDGDYKDPLTIMETIRLSYANNAEYYMILLVTLDRLKEIKKGFSIRNYPDEIAFKNNNIIHLKNQILFGFSCKEEFKERIKKTEEVISGDLKKVPYGKLLFNLYKDNFTGKMIIESSVDKGIFYFYEGLPIDVKFNRLQCTLGRMLLRKGVIDEYLYLQSLELMLRKKIRHGEALIELGVLKPSELLDLIELQKKEKLLFFFSRDFGSYKIYHEDITKSLITLEVDLFRLIYEGIKNLTPNQYLVEKYLPFKNHYVALSENFVVFADKLPFTELEKDFLEILKKNPALHDALDQTKLEFITTLKVLEILYVCEMLNFTESYEMARTLSECANPRVIQLKEAILRDYARFENKNFYEILEVNRNATSDDIKKSYLRLVKSYHPDKYAHLPLNKELMQKVSSIFQKIQIAYDTLIDPNTRKSYDSSLDTPFINEMLNETDAIVNAEIAFKKGEILLRRRNFKEAEKYFRESVKLNSQEPEYILNLAIAILYQKKKNNDSYDEESKKLLERAVYMNPYFDKAYYYLGIHSKLSGNIREAALYFKKAISINPNNKDAIMELKSIEKT